MQDYERAALELAALAESLGLSIKCAFVPFSQSRNAGTDWQSLNWRCTLERNGKPVTGLEAIEYGQGSGHCPASKAGVKHWGGNRHIMARAVALECETGRIAKPGWSGEAIDSRKPIAPPTVVDVLASLCLDAGALDYAGFEDWASEYGYDTDSRKANSVYRACLAHGLALRAAVGNDNLQALAALAHEL